MTPLLWLIIGGMASGMPFGLLAQRARRAADTAREEAKASEARAREAGRRLKPLLDVEQEVAKQRAIAAAERDAARAIAEQLTADTNKAVQEELATARTQADRMIEEARSIERASQEALRSRQEAMNALDAMIAEKEARAAELDERLRSLEENLELPNLGLYRPHFTYEDSESYKAAIEAVRERQKKVVKDGEATRGPKNMTLDGDKKAGQRLVKQQERLLLRAFNAESEAAIANVTWNNYDTMCTRISRAFDVLNELGAQMQTSLTAVYLQARLEELKLVYEAAEKKKQEKDRQRQERAAQREEERVQKELEKARMAAEKEEGRYEAALEKARQELAGAAAEQRDTMAARIAELEANLAEAHARKERAIAQAQLTRVGHVYIISNHGAFGEGVVKIGMTRRLEPEERIQELGDASVPFPFDLHALIYSDDAPGLEFKLHEAFWEHRLNWANDRKEFFRLDLKVVQAKLTELGLPTELHMIPEAREYRETLAAIGAVTAASSAR